MTAGAEHPGTILASLAELVKHFNSDLEWKHFSPDSFLHFFTPLPWIVFVVAYFNICLIYLIFVWSFTYPGKHRIAHKPHSKPKMLGAFEADLQANGIHVRSSGDMKSEEKLWARLDELERQEEIHGELYSRYLKTYGWTFWEHLGLVQIQLSPWYGCPSPLYILPLNQNCILKRKGGGAWIGEIWWWWWCLWHVLPSSLNHSPLQPVFFLAACPGHLHCSTSLWMSEPTWYPAICIHPY